MAIDLPRRRRQDVGNIIALEHVNMRVPRQDLATAFYVVGLGLTRDPYLRVGLENMWINVGPNQFHLPTGGPQVIRGTVELRMPDLDRLARSLEAAAPALEGTEFSFQVANDHVAATCPWGNRIRVTSDPSLQGQATLGMPRVVFDVATGTAAGIVRFYDQVIGAPGRVEAVNGHAEAHVPIGASQTLVFRETDAPLPGYDGHHVAVYVADFAGPYERLDALGLVSTDRLEYEYRFKRIVDPDGGAELFEVEHEVRSLTHPLYGRQLVNRNPVQTQQEYVPGADAFVG